MSVDTQSEGCELEDDAILAPMIQMNCGGHRQVELVVANNNAKMDPRPIIIKHYGVEKKLDGPKAAAPQSSDPKMVTTPPRPLKNVCTVLKHSEKKNKI